MSMRDGTPEDIEGAGMFGFPVVSQEWFNEEEQEDLAPEESEAPDEQDEEPALDQTPEEEEAPTSPEIAAENVEQTPAEAPEDEGEGTTSDAPRMYAGKFGTVEELERGYVESVSWATRVSQEASQMRTDLGRAAQLLQQMAPIVQQKLIEDNPELEEQFRVAETVKAQLAPEQERRQQEMAAAQQAAQLNATVSEFRARHPDVAPYSDLDYRWANTLQELGLPPGHPTAMEIGYEATINDGLKKVLKANPHWMQTQEGMELARAESARLFPTQRQPAKKRAAVNAAHTETGGAGSPVDGAPGGEEPDEFDGALRWWNKHRNNPLVSGF